MYLLRVHSANKHWFKNRAHNCLHMCIRPVIGIEALLNFSSWGIQVVFCFTCTYKVTSSYTILSRRILQLCNESHWWSSVCSRDTGTVKILTPSRPSQFACSKHYCNCILLTQLDKILIFHEDSDTDSCITESNRNTFHTLLSLYAATNHYIAGKLIRPKEHSVM